MLKLDDISKDFLAPDKLTIFICYNANCIIGYVIHKYMYVKLIFTASMSYPYMYIARLILIWKSLLEIIFPF